jgi:hypothetical protein
MISFMKIVVLLATVGFHSGIASQAPSETWVALDSFVEYQAAPSSGTYDQPTLRRSQQRFLGYSDSFVDSAETTYDGYSQAWRLLGVYIDCSATAVARRNLQGDDGQADDIAGGQNQQATCARYLLWAAVRRRRSIKELLVMFHPQFVTCIYHLSMSTHLTRGMGLASTNIMTMLRRNGISLHARLVMARAVPRWIVTLLYVQTVGGGVRRELLFSSHTLSRCYKVDEI